MLTFHEEDLQDVKYEQLFQVAIEWFHKDIFEILVHFMRL